MGAKIREQFMNNIFQIGGQVKGQSFIGRKELIKRLKKDFLEHNGNPLKAIIGLPRIGKTSLALNVFDNVDNCIYINLGESNCYEEIWQNIAKKIKKYLKKNNINIDRIKEDFEEIKSKNPEWIDFMESVKNIFIELKDLKFIIVLDEFDKAKDLFKRTAHFELFRTIFSDQQYNVSAMLLSRRKLITIEGNFLQSSTFHLSFDEIPLGGFDDSEIEEYYNKFTENGIELNNEQKGEIEYYAGRSPYLLSIIGDNIIKSAENNEPIDIQKIFLNKCSSINDYYRDCISKLEEDKNLERLIPFIIGPKIGVTPSDKDELKALGLLREVGEKYIAISEHFATYLSAELLKFPIFEIIINVEKDIKKLINKHIVDIIREAKVDGKNINELQKAILSILIPDKDIDIYNGFIKSNKYKYNRDSTYFDVMSLKISFQIIEKFWDSCFKKYFKPEGKDEWRIRFKKCGEARNPIAHGHEEYLDDAAKNEVNAYCKKIHDKLSDVLDKAKYPTDEEILRHTTE